MSNTAVIAVDWGTSRLRAFRMAEDGTILDARNAPAGIRVIDDGDFEGAFMDLLGDWLKNGTPKIVLGGMIGSRQGWIEAPYLRCPADPRDLAATAISGTLGNGRTFWIAPGLSTRIGERADVMRGEELQIFGAMDMLGSGRHLICLPGTHSKWVILEDGVIRDFRTYMTGELFEILCRHSMLGRSIEHAHWSNEGFRVGLETARKQDDLLADLFSVRAGVLLETLSVEDSGAYLSGLLIGTEVSHALRDFGYGSEVCIIGNPDLTDLYTPAIAHHAIACRQLGEYTGALGLFRLAKDLPTED